MKFKLVSDYQPTGDQPQAIAKLTSTIEANNPHQTLKGITGSGKTFSVAHIIEKTQLPTLVISHNKTLAAQLYQEFRDFFPENAVNYFVSYYDYYQPEAYIPQTDTYIEKEADINAEIDRLRLSATANLLSRPDCIIVASVSAIYNLGSPLEYQKNILELTPGQLIDRATVISRLTDLQYSRTQGELSRGKFRVIGSTLQLFPADENHVVSLHFSHNALKDIKYLDLLNFHPIQPANRNPHSHVHLIYPAKHFITNPITQNQALKQVERDLQDRLKILKASNRLLEAQRLEQKVNYDLSMIRQMGFVNGIENYSRYFDGRKPGEPPFTLLDHFHHNVTQFGHKNFLTVIDESHISLPQIRGMYRGDKARKETLIDYGFRLPSALDNRPLTFSEFQQRIPISLYTSATPSDYELSLSKTGKIKDALAFQVIRPTGLLDPEIEIRPSQNQAQDIIAKIRKRKQNNQRTLILTLTKQTAQDLADYIKEKQQPGDDIKVQYLHSDVKTLDRQDILDDLRQGNFDCLVGVNLLREGLDLPEVSLVMILDADKEGFLRTATSLIQIMGRAARHTAGQVILYADRVSNSMKQAIEETNQNRKKQISYNKKHTLVPQDIQKPIRQKLLQRDKQKLKSQKRLKELEEFGWKKVEEIDPQALTPQDKQKLVKKLTRLMNQAAKNWEFEQAAHYRDLIQKLES